MAAPHRVTFVIGELGKGGAEYQLYELLRAIDRSRFVPEVIVLAEGGYWAEPIRRLGIDVHEIPRAGGLDLRRLARLRRRLRTSRPDILHAVRWSGNSYGRLAALGLGVPVVIASERVHEEHRPWVRRAIDRLLDPVTNAYLVNCEAIAAGLRGQVGIAAHRIRVIPNGIDLARLPPPLADRRAGRVAAGLAPERRLVAGVGRLTAQKDFTTFLAAAEAIVGAIPDVDLVIVGEGEERGALEARARELGLEERLRFLGLRHDVPTLLRGVDVLLMTSRFEGFPNAVLEAMAMGAVAVATAVGGCGELIRDGETGTLIPPGDPAAAACAVIDVLKDTPRATSMAGAARRHVERELTVEVLARRTEAFYAELLADASSRRAAA